MVCFFFYLCSSKRNRKFKHLAPVVRQADNAIHWIAQLVSLTVIRWIVIYPVDSVIQLLTNWGLVQTKPMGENTITNIMKVSVAGTSLKESEKKVYESLWKENNSQEAEESKDCKFRTYRQCHRPQKYKCPLRLR